VSLVVLLGAATVAVLWDDNRKITASFVNAESSYVPPSFVDPFYVGPPSLWDVEFERLAFAVRNDGSLPLTIEVSDIKDEHGNWVKYSQRLGDAPANRTTRLYLHVPKGCLPQAARLHGFGRASAVEKTRAVLGLLLQKAWGRHPGKVIWPENLIMPASECIVRIDTDRTNGLIQ